MISIKLDMSGVEAFAKRLDHVHEQMPGAISRALNRAGDSAATQLGRVLSKQSGLGVRDVRDNVTTKHATPGDLTYEIEVSGKSLTLAEFKPRETKRGVSAAPWGQRRTFSHTFMWNSRVWVRTSAERLPIRQLFGPNMARELTRGEAIEVVTKTANEVFMTRLKHEVDRLMKGKG